LKVAVRALTIDNNHHKIVVENKAIRLLLCLKFEADLIYGRQALL